jgi:hypothetical protein
MMTAICSSRQGRSSLQQGTRWESQARRYVMLLVGSVMMMVCVSPLFWSASSSH